MAMRRVTLTWRALGALVAASVVGALVLAGGSVSHASASGAGESSASKQAPLRLKAHNVPDRLVRMKAARMLVPVGWRARGGVVWDLRYHTLASAVMQIRSQKGPEALETFPLIPHVWDTQGIFGFPEGSLYLGAIVQRPLRAAPFLEQLAIPHYRRGLRMRVVKRVRLAKVARVLTKQARKLGILTASKFDAARVRVAYSERGRAIEEDFYTVVSYTTSPLLPTRVSWQPHFLYSFRAARGKLDRQAALLQAISSSVRLNLRWYAGYLYVQQLWIDGQMKAIRGAGALSRAIAKANDEITESIRGSYRNQQDAYDRVHGSFSEQIRGVETYENPFEGREIQLPSEYSYAWVSAGGEYLLTDQAGFNPNVGSTTDWRLLRTA